jgi:hypothetical protein
MPRRRPISYSYHREFRHTLEGRVKLHGSCDQWLEIGIGTPRVFRHNFALEVARGSHACSLEALACV